MSKLNASRIINLNYNKNTIRINDEIFEFGGESTLMSLRNGGGKTVMVQMLLAPFVKNRDLKDRKFTDYFNSSLPTYILSEWKLDNNSGYVLIGMAVRKKQMILDEENGSDLESITFIHEYKSGNEYDIHNIPLVEHNKSGLKIKSLAEVRKMFEELKNNRNYIFDYYEMSSDHYRRKYYSKLAEFGISHKEWEKIIQKINMKESGLSELFSKSKNITSLVNDWFLPAIEDKLNYRTIESFQKILGKYIYQLKDNESKLLLKRGIEEFKEFSNKVLISTEELEAAQNKIKESENGIANFYSYIKRHIDIIREEELKLAELKENINGELNEIEYEKLSIEYYELLEDIKNHEETSELLQGSIEALQKEKDRFTRELAILECARLMKDYTEASSSVLDLEYKLANAKKDDAEKSKQLNDVGYSLYYLYSKKVNELKSLLEVKHTEAQAKEKEIADLVEHEEDKNRRINRLTNDIATLKEKMSAFERSEEHFKSRYSDFIAYRNLFGEYDEASLDVYDKKLAKREDYQRNSLEAFIANREDITKKQEKNTDELQNVRIEKSEKNSRAAALEEALKGIEEKCDRIKKIQCYCDIDESYLFNKEHIKDVITGKLNALNQERDNLLSDADKQKQLLEMYESGKNIRLPDEFIKKLDELDIPIMYGLMWLKKQELPQERKLKIIEGNPFLPYSIIMSASKIKLLKTSELNIFTSFPIPIIEQERLEQVMEVKVVNGLLSMQDMNFYISFNEKLLNEEELKLLIEGIRRKIQQSKVEMEIKAEEIKKYNIDLEDVNRFDVKKSDIDNTKAEISKLLQDVEQLIQKDSLIVKDLDSCKNIIKDLDKKVEQTKAAVADIDTEKREYRALMEQYAEYKINNSRKKVLDEEKMKDEAEQKNLKLKIKEEDLKLKALRDEISNLSFSHEQDNKNLNNYLSYREGNLLVKDIVDLEADYKSLKSGMGLKVEEYTEYLNKENLRFKLAESELGKKEKEHSLSEAEYKFIIFDTVKMDVVKAGIRGNKKKLDEEGEKKRKEDNALIKLDTNKDNQIKRIKELTGRDRAKDIGNILDLDFKGRKEIKQIEFSQCLKKMEQNTSDMRTLNKNLDALDQFKDIEITEEKAFEIKYSKLAVTRLEYVGEFNNLKHEENLKRTALGDCIAGFSSGFSYRIEDYFKNSIDILLEIKHSPEDVKQTILTVQEVHERTMLQLQSDLARLEEEENTIITTLLDYVEEIYKQMDTIDNNSSLNIGGRSYKMLNIEQPEWKQDIYHLKMSDYIDRVARECKDYLSFGKSIDDVLGKEITTSRLYEHIVGINDIDIKLYKIETSKVVRISWNEVAQNSGGEGFVSAFIILICLLSYMRREESMLYGIKEEGKVLIMDNPFAQTNAEHLLKPLTDIAKKYNTQLICFTGLGGDSIYNRFDNIYVLNLMDSKLHKGLQIMESEHKKGEEITQMTSSRFLISNEKAEQITLF